VKHLPERPGKKGVHGIEEGNEKRPERREDGETRSRPGVCVAA